MNRDDQAGSPKILDNGRRAPLFRPQRLSRDTHWMETSVFALISRMDHWGALELGDKWVLAGKALAEIDTASASKAFVNANMCFQQYQTAWETNPASRWDPDAMVQIQEVHAELQRLYANPAIVDTSFPPWAAELLSGILPTGTEPSAPYLDELAGIAKQLQNQ